MDNKILNISPLVAIQNPTKVGEAEIAKNFRENNYGLEVVGKPIKYSHITPGHQIAYANEDIIITISNNQLFFNNAILLTLESNLIRILRIQNYIIIVTYNGIILYEIIGGRLEEIDTSLIAPEISIAAIENESLSSSMSAITFSQSYSSWPATLINDDVSKITNELKNSWAILQNQIDNSSKMGSVVLVRYALRLKDDSYLWCSPAVRLGDNTIDDNNYIVTDTDQDGTDVIGIPATIMSRHCYSLGLAVKRGIGSNFLSIIKSVDILATISPSQVDTNSTCHYRAIGRGGMVNRNRLEFGLQKSSSSQIDVKLEESKWHIVASTTDFESLNQNRWISDQTTISSEIIEQGFQTYLINKFLPQKDVLTNEEIDEMSSIDAITNIADARTYNGRLIIADNDGYFYQSAINNPFQIFYQQLNITGLKYILSMPKAIYSSGFGKYPFVAFTSSGIYAIPQISNSYKYGEPRLISNTIANNSEPIIAFDNLIAFVDEFLNLVILNGSKIEIIFKSIGNVLSMAWSAKYFELSILTDNHLFVFNKDFRFYERDLNLSQLYSCNHVSLAISEDGNVSNINAEETDTMNVHWLSSRIQFEKISSVIWNLFGNINSTLTLRGERGVSCHGFIIGSIMIDGELNAPIRDIVFPQPYRYLRLEIFGSATSGNLFEGSILE